eukprot:scaffold293_cov121-Isochrysis_galbana.AAC.7
MNTVRATPKQRSGACCRAMRERRARAPCCLRRERCTTEREKAADAMPISITLVPQRGDLENRRGSTRKSTASMQKVVWTIIRARSKVRGCSMPPQPSFRRLCTEAVGGRTALLPARRCTPSSPTPTAHTTYEPPRSAATIGRMIKATSTAACCM